MLVAALAHAEILGFVPPGAFRPPPQVESAFVGFTPRSTLEATEYRRLVPLVRAAFALRRKTLRNSLATRLGVETATRLVEAAGLAAETRAERLGVEEFRGLLATLGEIAPELPE